MEASVSFFENWKFLLAVAIVLIIAVVITFNFVINKKKVSAKNSSVAAGDDINSPININSNNKN